MRPARLGLALGIAALLLTTSVEAQSWRLRFEAAAQRVAFRGLSPDSIREADAQTGPDGGPVTADGFAVNCFGDGFCRFYRPGSIRRGLPASLSSDLMLWGLGVRGLSVHVNARGLTDFTGDRLWPGTSPALRLVEGYAELVRGGLTVRAGRMLESSRLGGLGSAGLDGGRATWRFDRLGLELGGYLGWGFARGTILPITSPAVNPLADYQPSDRQIVAGAIAGLRLRTLDVQAEYRREVDPLTDYFVAERAALSLQFRPVSELRLSGGADYDIAQGLWGSADAVLAYSGRRVWVTAGARHYRPFFDLWTVWGAFSPVPYNAVNGSLAVNPVHQLQLRVRGEWFRYDEAGATTPTVDVLDRGWRWSLEGTATPAAAWTVTAGVHDERRPGASSRGIDGEVSYRPRENLELALQGGSLARPLELRFQDGGVEWLGASADLKAGETWRFRVSLDRYWDSRERPDAASFDWNQWRLSTRVSLWLRSGADRWVLPPARRTGSAP